MQRSRPTSTAGKSDKRDAVVKERRAHHTAGATGPRRRPGASATCLR